VCGDFNYWGNGPVPALVRQSMLDVGHVLHSTSRTYHSRWPLFRLDRMYVDRGVRPLTLSTHRTPLAMLASDHLPLVMRCEAPIEELIPSHPVELVG
jgi:endonuclease/exonuclease/phosphatase family metal-dependent hydrolase